MNLLNRKEIAARLGIKSQNFLAIVLADPGFPKPVIVNGIKRQRWIEADIDNWILKLPKKKGQAS